MKSLSGYALENRAIVKFLIAVLLAGGVFAFMQMSKMEDPEIRVKQAVVVTVYPGASAHDVELKVSDVLEKAIRSMGDVDYVESKSMHDVSLITVNMLSTVPDAEIEQKWDMLRRKVNDARAQLPAGAAAPVVEDDFGDVYGMFYALTGDGYDDQELMNYAWMVQRELQNIDGVGKVQLYGSRKPCVDIEINQNKVANLGVHPSEILMTLNGQNKSVYSGYFNSGHQRLRVEVSDSYRTIGDIENLVIQGHEEDQLRLRDIARVTEGFEEPVRNGMSYDGKKAFGIAVSIEKGYDIVKVGAKVTRLLDTLKADKLPAGIDFHPVFYQPRRVIASIGTFLVNLVESILIVIFILMLTMGFRSGVIIGTGLLITVLGSFVVLYMLDGTLQRVSLGALIVAMGMLVDNAIVVLDGILVDSARGMKKPQSLTHTADKTAMPLLGATLIAILAFFPIFLSPDTTGVYVRDLFIVLAVSLLLSWVLALVHIPIHSDRYLKIKPAAGAGVYDTPLYRRFRQLLSYLLSHRLATLGTVLLLVAVSALIFMRLPQGFFPNLSYDQLYMEVKLPEGTKAESVRATIDEIQRYLSARPEITHVTCSYGGTPARYNLVRSIAKPSMSYGELIVDFDRPESLEKNRRPIQDYLTRHYPDAYIRLKRYNLMYMDYPVEVMFSGPDPAVLKKLTAQAEEIMRREPSAVLVRNNWEPMRPTLLIGYNQPTARRSGLARSDIGTSLLSVTDGIPVGTYYEGVHAKTIFLKSVDARGEQVKSIDNAPVWSALPSFSVLDRQTVGELLTGSKDMEELLSETMGATPLNSVTKGTGLKWEDPVVYRYNGIRSMNAQCNNADGFTAAQVKARLEPEIDRIALPAGYTKRWMGEYKASSDSLKYLFKNLPLAIVLIIGILIGLFRDFRKPAVILLCLPMAVIGISFAMLVSGKEFGFVAIVGALGLIGMMIKNGVVLIDEITLQMRAGVEPVKALLDSSASRLRPVMMAAGTTILGMVPLLSDDMFGSLAVTIMGGLLVGTVITLMVIPVLYALFFGIRNEPPAGAQQPAGPQKTPEA